MKRYIKDGSIKPRNKIVVVKDGRQYINPREDMILADGWVKYVEPEPTEEELLEKAKVLLEKTVEKYDASDEVNCFYMQGQKMWLDKATRAGLMLRFQAEQAIGNEYTTLWYDGNQYAIPLLDAFKMLYALEIYASQCYDNTHRHLAAIQSLQTLGEIENYDYSVGYPEKLSFN